MSREMTLIVLGLLTMVIPYTGFPSPWRTALLLLVGAAVAIVGFLQRGEMLRAPRRSANEHHTFEESPRHISDVKMSEPEFHAE